MAKKPAAIKKAFTKSQLLGEIAESTGVSKKDVGAVLDELSSLVERHIQKGAAGQFTLPGLLKVKAVKRPAQPARKGVPNPFKPGEKMNIPAKPASIRVRILPLKKMKEMAA